MWDAKSNPVSRPQKAVTLRPVTSRERTTTAEQTVAVDRILSDRNNREAVTKLPLRPATANPSLPSPRHVPIRASKPGPRPHLQIQLPQTSQSPQPSILPNIELPSPPASAAPFKHYTPLTQHAENESLGGPIASREQIRAWMTQPAQPPLSNVSNNLHTSAESPISPVSPFATSPVPFSPGRNAYGRLSSKQPSGKIKRPNTAHEIRRKPPPGWEPEIIL